MRDYINSPLVSPCGVGRAQGLNSACPGAQHERTHRTVATRPRNPLARGTTGADRRPEGALWRAMLYGPAGARATWPRRVIVSGTATRCRGVRRAHAGRGGRRQAGERSCRAGHSLRRRHLARGPPARGPGRHQHRRQPHEQGAGGERGGPHRDGAARRHAQAAQRRDQEYRPVLPDRSGCRCDARRHGRDPRQRHQRRALRHHARERARPGSGHGRRRDHSHRHPCQEIQRRLRPDAPDGGQRRDARRDHRSHGAPVPAA